MEKEKEFEKYYLKYYNQVYGYILKKVSIESITEDLTRDVFYSVWEKFDSFDENKASFQTWLYVIVNNKIKNYYRDRKEFAELDDSIADRDAQTDDILDAVYFQYLRDHLYIAIEKLNDIQQQIIILKYFKNMNSSEIADHTGLSPGNVRIQLKRALDKVREYFKEKI
jgi:RNA polymerase sigma-70 factor (ECF subfamily)